MEKEKTPILDIILKRSPQVEEFIEKVRNDNKYTAKEQDILIMTKIFLEDANKNLSQIKEMQSQYDNLIVQIQKEVKKVSNEERNKEKKVAAKKIGKKLIKGYDKLFNSINKK